MMRLALLEESLTVKTTEPWLGPFALDVAQLMDPAPLDRGPGPHEPDGASQPSITFARVEQAETQGLREVGASVRTTHVAAGAAVKNQSAEVSHSPRRIENKRLPATGSTQGANLVDRTISTLATTAP
jgi:hypothetical protein